MPRSRPGHLRQAVVCMLLPLLFAPVGPGQGVSQSEHESILKSLVAQYYGALVKRDIDDAMACWAVGSPQRAAKAEELRRTAASTGEARAYIVDVHRVRINGDQAWLRADIDIGLTERGAPRRSHFDLECVKEEGRWVIWHEEVAQIALAGRLAELGKKGDRETLLKSEEELKSPSLCRALVWRGDRLGDQGEHAKAYEIYELSLNVAQDIGDQGSEAEALRGMASSCALIGKLDQALELARRSLELRQQVGDRAAIAAGLVSLGYIHRLRDELGPALEYYRKGLTIRSELGNKSGVASTLREIGVIHYLQGEYTEALDFYAQSLRLYEELQLRSEIAQTLYNNGVVHRALADFDRALDYYEQSRRIRMEMADRNGVASCLLSIANVYSDKGQYSKAIECYQQGMEIRKSLKDQLGIALSLNGMANIYLMQGHADRALAYYEEGLAIYRSSTQMRGVASALENIAAAHSSLGRYDRALEFYEKALLIHEELKDNAGIAHALGGTGIAFLRRKEPLKALEPLGRSLALAEELGDKFGISIVSAWIAEAQRELGNAEQSVSLATRAADMARIIQAPFALWQACTALGEALRGLHQPEQSREAFEEAVMAIEGLRGEVAGDESERAGFLANMVSPYHGLVELALDQSQGESALSYAERAKGRTLLEVLRNGREDIDSVLADPEKAEARQRANAVASISSRIAVEGRRAKPDQKRIVELKAGLETARFDREAFETNVYAVHPELRVRRGEVPPFTASEAVRLLPGANAALLEFVVTERKAYLFVVTRRGTGDASDASVRSYPIPSGREDLDRRVQAFRKQIADRDLEFRASAAGLFDLLLGPARGDLKGRASIVIVPDGPLWDLPFQALVSGGKYLWEQCEISYAPSLAVLQEMAGLHKKRTAGRAGLPSLLAMGNPSLAGTLEGGGHLPLLPEAEEQVRRIGRLYGSRGKVYLGNEASEERFKKEAGSFGIIHLATHAILVDTNPLYSHVVMSPGGADDGELEAREILRLRLGADLVVLSACETARGRVGAGEGMIGLSWALFVAGCPAAVLSQWKVDAAATTALMVEFHRRLQAGLHISVSAALRQAALETMRDPRYRHPFYWAGFILVGDGS
jgi:CHAT domain-containing protein